MASIVIERAKAGWHRAARLATDKDFQRRLKFRLRVLSLLPPLVGFAAMALLATIPQMREVYLGIIFDHDLPRALAGFGLLALFCAFLYTWAYWLGATAVDIVYPEHADLRFDLALMRWRNNKALLCAALPLLGLLLGLIGLHLEAASVSMRFGDIIKHFEPRAQSAIRDEFRDTGVTLQLMWAYVSVAVGLVIVTLASMHRWLRRDEFGHRTRKRITLAATAVTIGIAVVPLLMPDATVGLMRALGPLAGTALVLTGIATTLAGLSWVVKWMDPAVSKGLSAAAVVLLGVYVLVISIGSAENVRQDVSNSVKETSSPPNLDVLRRDFKQWLEKRGDRARYAGRPYPVLVLAAQGGGIYATSSAALFLASMQDECANFAQHTFAVSAVSGGAVGAAMFSGVLDGKAQSPGPCAGLPRSKGLVSNQPMTDAMQGIVLEDHLSPVLGLIAPDVLRKVWPLAWEKDYDRSDALERSFACSFDSVLKGEAGGSVRLASCPQTAKGSGLRTDYAAVWSTDKAIPAPILNTTWAEMGYRVAFAPFPLRAAGDGTLFNFTELPLKPDQLPHSLIEAAFVSARFPGIVPARRMEPDIPGLRWNFVDGAYVDNSGATTAVELYKALERIAREERLSVDLRLVLLTNAETDLDYGKINGTLAGDTVAPVNALLNVRNQLSQRAVTQAIAAIDPARSRSSLDRRSPESKDHKVWVVDVEQQTFKLPLGWKISRVTNDIVRLMMGRPDLCPADAPQRPPPAAAIKSMVDTIEQNSCVKRNLVRLLKAES